MEKNLKKIKVENIEFTSFGTYHTEHFTPKITLIFDVEISITYPDGEYIGLGGPVIIHRLFEVNAQELLFNCDGVYNKLNPFSIKLTTIKEYLLKQLNSIADECNAQQHEFQNGLLFYDLFCKKLNEYALVEKN